LTTAGAVPLAAIHYETGFRIDDFLSQLIALLRARQVRVGGAIQLNPPDAVNSCSAMTLVDLASGARMGISQNLGSQAQGCRLDTTRLAEFGTMLDGKPSDDVDLLLFNKFGRAEAEGYGLRSNFVGAIEAGIPVLTAVRPPYDEAWQRFHGGLALDLAPDLQRAQDWCLSAVAARRRTTIEPLGTSPILRSGGYGTS
jgi:hypothetical protein